ncbi:MAG: type 2 isopentenyl-diphosphate Delta-isomerase [Proteobacteria bacterium]|nr:type 2 isopentenyl-diphosphate Delta-isomerase [Cystobacterineae bacterium]MCL2258780.1 type 2 isopentenyl-diphosphate Delta-isomerase [Cystobacterineae bacterium]MCL2314692.1 type 2 isopentenyl-diphosphate Delta-isomerase [Pseudomonadota bacterium]
MSEETTARRKDDHLEICATQEVEPPANKTLFGCVHLIHCAMPEMALEEADLSCQWFGKRLKAPLLIAGMTGGTERALTVNRALARVAQEHGIALGLGSQRAMGEREALAATFAVRDVAPTALVIGNIGLRQAAELGIDKVRRLADAIGADALALHLNPAQELAQPEGDRDFRGGYKVVEMLIEAFGERLVVKETGCGISPKVAKRLVSLGIESIDVSGLGGTSWIRVEQLRNEVGEGLVPEFAGWGIPTAAAIASVRDALGPMANLVASGGIRSGLEVAKALALGADIVGMALPFFRAVNAGGEASAVVLLRRLIHTLKQTMLLCGARDIEELRRKPKVVGEELRTWLEHLKE